MTATPPPYPQPGYYPVQPPLRAPEGTKPGTVWIWLFTLLPIVQMIASLPLLLSIGDLYGKMFALIDVTGQAPTTAAVQNIIGGYLALLGPMLWVSLLGYLLMGVGVLFGWLDWRELRRRGVPKPFHWAWGFFAFAGAGTLVTLIGRSVVVRRRTGEGLAPLWTGIVVYVVIFVATMVWVFWLMTTMLSSITVR